MIEVAVCVLVGLVPAIVLHEYAHGLVAYWLGDSTAKNCGRLSINPIRHMDPVGTVLVPGALLLSYVLHMTQTLYLFGWAKPVPIDMRAFRHPRRGMMLVALAGPVVNMIIAMILAKVFQLVDPIDMPGTGILAVLGSWMDPLAQVLLWAIQLNLMLAVFNLIPIPPLDGSRIVSGLLPLRLAVRYNRIEPFGILIVLVLMNLGMLRFMYPLIDFLTLLLGVRL